MNIGEIYEIIQIIVRFLNIVGGGKMDWDSKQQIKDLE